MDTVSTLQFGRKDDLPLQISQRWSPEGAQLSPGLSLCDQSPRTALAMWSALERSQQAPGHPALKLPALAPAGATHAKTLHTLARPGLWPDGRSPNLTVCIYLVLLILKINVLNFPFNSGR